MNPKKSQIAVEFLVTYGWALLAVMISIGVLVYFGVFNTSRYVDDTCNFGKQIVCEDYIMRGNGNLSLRLRNNFGVPIDINNIMIKSSYNPAKTCNPAVISPNPANITQYSSINMTCNIGVSSLTANEKIALKVTIGFRRSGSINNPLHNQTGDISLTAQ